MLTVRFSDGFTGDLVSFDALITAHECEIKSISAYGKVREKGYTVKLEADKFNLLSILKALNTLNERYERPIDGLGSITCAYKWDNKMCERYFSGYQMSDCAETVEDKNLLRALDDLLLRLRSSISKK